MTAWRVHVFRYYYRSSFCAISQVRAFILFGKFLEDIHGLLHFSYLHMRLSHPIESFQLDGFAGFFRQRLTGLTTRPPPSSTATSRPAPEPAPVADSAGLTPTAPSESDAVAPADDPESELARAAVELPIDDGEPEPAMDDLLKPGKKRAAKSKRRRNRGPRRAVDSGATQAAYERGVEHLRARKALLALEELAKVVQANPSHAKAYRALGQAYAMLGRGDAAVTALETYLRLEPSAKDAEQVRKFISANR